MTDEITAPSVSEVKLLAQKAAALLSANALHLCGQAIAWITIATHDVSKWETASAVLGTLSGTAVIKKIGTWLGVSK